MVQYMEQFVLQCMQHIPMISDRHLIEKLARHYNKEIQIAVVKKGMTTINSFEVLLHEYMGRRARVNNELQKAASERSSKKFKRKKQQPDQTKGRPTNLDRGGEKSFHKSHEEKVTDRQ